ncbi:alpha/beta hydrolase family protein [Costertonia aggregata]|uniref:Alpha/beta hydrolase n=1 Tax=Costertonia aggregata TaxID=343403 RepID=A0A7H9AKS5_9FLAO|nr:alpha/beta hydrolase [Costertonia aggregata]QLG43934.1 alpha/beta hydrolase [Costertonia aggregata]
MPNVKIHVYFMPGMAANTSIFEHINLPTEQFETHFLDWTIPKRGIGIEQYAEEMCKNIVHENPVLIGVSFGGILVQEMAKLIPVRKLIIVSSIKTKTELPKRMLFARYTKVHKLLPTGIVNNVELLAKYAFGETVTKRLRLYEKYLSIRDKYYIDWCIDQLVNWKQTKYPKNLVHIQGEQDAVFPINNIEACTKVKKGTHTMIIHRAKWFNEHLPTIILE